MDSPHLCLHHSPAESLCNVRGHPQPEARLLSSPQLEQLFLVV